MNVETEQSLAKNSNPVLTVTKDGTALYSNEAGESLLHEWGVEVGGKLPLSILNLAKRVISYNSPEKTEIKVENRRYMIVFSPLPEQECVNISGFDISDQKKLEEKILKSESQGVEERNTLVEELRKSEERFRSVLENSLDSAYRLDLQNNYFDYMSPVIEKITGFSPNELNVTGKNGLLDRIHPEDLPQVIAGITQSLDEGFGTHEYRFKCKDGKYRWLADHFSIIKDKTGMTRFRAGIVRNITEQKRAEEALRESEEKFRSAFDDSAVAMALVGPDARLMKVNDAFCRLLGFEKSETEGSTFLDFTYPDDIKPSILTHKAVINREKPYFWLVKRYTRKDGRVIWCEVSSSPVFDSKGCPIYTVAHVQDITERKEAEEALQNAYDCLEERVKERTAELEEAYISLKESEERLSEAQRIAHLGNYDNNLVSDKLYWSDELYRIFGLQPQEGMTFNKFLTYIHPEDKDYVGKAVIEAINGKHYAINYRIIRPDGQERIVHSEREAIFDKTNKPIRAKGTIQDVTEHKKSEEKIQNLANIVESSNDAIGTISLDGLILSWNKGAEQVYGYSTEEISGKPVTVLAPSHLKDETIILSERVKKGEKIRNYETIRQRKDGKMIYVSFSLSPVFDIHKKLIAISFISRDITKRKKAEEALNNIEIARKQEIHHRIKNNLQVISSLLDLQASKFKGKKNIEDSQILEAFRESQDRVISMALIHEELHKGGKVDTLNFSHYIRELAYNLILTYRLGNESISLDMDTEEDISFDMDTAVPLGIIINELVSNSLKHAFPNRDNGKIQIKLHRQENGESKSEDCNLAYILTVSDNGIGIPANLDTEDIDSLGLQLVATLVDQLDGELELKRDNGTEFTIKFIVKN